MRSLYKLSKKALLARFMWETSWQDLETVIFWRLMWSILYSGWSYFTLQEHVSLFLCGNCWEKCGNTWAESTWLKNENMRLIFLMAVFILKWTKCTNNLRKHTNICKFVTNEDPCVCVRACVCVWILYIYIYIYIYIYYIITYTHIICILY